MIRFRPLPGLTIVTLICLAILLSLGTWQYNRLHWKRDLLIRIDRAANAAPIESLSELSQLIEAREPIDFRRIQLDGRFTVPRVNDGIPFYQMRSTGKLMEWRPYRIYEDDAFAVFIEGEGIKDKPELLEPVTVKPASIAGYVRTAEKPNIFIPRSKPETNSWFAFNPIPETLDWYDASDASVLRDVYIAWQPSVEDVNLLPVKIPNIPNNHLDYMLTWYSFALILLVIYFILHKRQGRLKFGL